MGEGKRQRQNIRIMEIEKVLAGAIYLSIESTLTKVCMILDRMFVYRWIHTYIHTCAYSMFFGKDAFNLPHPRECCSPRPFPPSSLFLPFYLDALESKNMSAYQLLLSVFPSLFIFPALSFNLSLSMSESRNSNAKGSSMS